MADDWEWRIGTLNGYGESAWQQLGDVIRRPTIILPSQSGGAGLLTPISLQLSDGVPASMQFPAEKLVCASQPAKKDVAADLDRHWAGSRIIVGNGGVPMGPRRMP